MSFLQHLRHVLSSKIQKSTCMFYVQVTTTSYTEGGVRDKSALYNAQKSTKKFWELKYRSRKEVQVVGGVGLHTFLTVYITHKYMC